MNYIYRHIRLDKNEVFYIGIGTKEKSYKGPGREYHRAFSKRKRSNFWNNITAKTPYEVEIMLDDLTLVEAKIKEVEFIKLYGRRDLGLGTLCNLTDGGEGTTNIVVSNETKKKLGKAAKGRKHKVSTIIKMKATSRLINKNTTGHKVEYLPTGEIYNSLSDACRAIGQNRNSIDNKMKTGTFTDFKIHARPKRETTTRSKSRVVRK